MSCLTCQSAKAALQCGLCLSSVCKSCARFLPSDAFAFQGNVPENLKCDTYCSSCFELVVVPKLDEYHQILERAKDVNVFFKAQSKESRFIRRVEKHIQVEDCSDRDEVVLKLAFIAALGGFNVILDVETTARKIHHGKWQSSIWSGRAIPALVDPKRL